MRIIFKHLQIKNFKGIKSLEIDFNEKITNILGANHIGKTTVADAIHWVLFGKNNEGQSVFGIDPKDDSNKIINHLENEVSLILSVDGTEKEIKKIRKETWSKPRGYSEEALTGHTTDCFINGNKYTIKDYQAEINLICNESLFKAITNPAYFPSLKSDDQRSLLLKMIGELSLSEIANKKEEFKDFIKELNGEDLKSYRSHLAYKMKNLKQEIEVIPSRITENEEILQKTEENIDFVSIRKRLKEIEEDIKKYDEQLEDNSAKLSQDYEKKVAQRKLLNTLKSELSEIENEVERGNREKRETYEGKLTDLKYKLRKTEQSRDEAVDCLEHAKKVLQSIELQTADFRKKWKEVEDRVFLWDEEQEVCPHCGQKLPSDDIKELKDKAHEQWAVRHMAEQDNLDIEAKALKEKRNRVEAEIANYKNQKESLTKDVVLVEKEIKESELLKEEPMDYKENPKWLRLMEEIKTEEKVLDSMCEKSENNSTINVIKGKKQELLNQRDELKLSLSKESLIAERKERISQLSQQMKQLNQQLSDLEHKDFTASNLELAFIQNLEERVNKLFMLIKFKMFETLLNGSTKPTCVLTMHGVPYNDLSNSEKINAGIDLIRAMNAYNDTYAPIIVDNAESCNSILPTESQQILLVVSRDKKLVVVNE